MVVKSKVILEAEKSYAQVVISLLAAFAYIMSPSLAFASPTNTGNGTISESISTVATNVGQLPYFFQFIFYIVGLALLAKGLFNGKRLAEDPRAQGGILAVLGPVVIGSLLLITPSVTELILNSIANNRTIMGDTLNVRNASTGQTIGAAINNFGQNTLGGGQRGLYDFVSYICYIVGVILLGSALQGGYKLTAGAQGAPQVSGLVWRAIGSALLMSMPFAAEMIRKSIFPSANIHHNFAMSTFTVVTGEGLDAALTQLVADIRDPVIDITFGICFLIGIIMIAQALYAMSGIGFAQQKLSPQQIIIRFIFGGLMVSSWSLYEAVVTSIFATSPTASKRVLAYTTDILDATKADAVNNVANAIFVWIQIVGLIAFFRGWFTLKASLDGGNTPKSAGLTQVIAGALLINIPTTVQWIANTMGIKAFV